MLAALVVVIAWSLAGVAAWRARLADTLTRVPWMIATGALFLVGLASLWRALGL